jgi:hypothetical protein
MPRVGLQGAKRKKAIYGREAQKVIYHLVTPAAFSFPQGTLLCL